MSYYYTLKFHVVIFSLYNKNYNLEINTQLAFINMYSLHTFLNYWTFSSFPDKGKLTVDDSSNCKDLNYI